MGNPTGTEENSPSSTPGASSPVPSASGIFSLYFSVVTGSPYRIAGSTPRGGIEPRTDSEILTFMREQAEIAISHADVIVFLTDIKTGLTASDQEVAGMFTPSSRRPARGKFVLELAWGFPSPRPRGYFCRAAKVTKNALKGEGTPP